VLYVGIGNQTTTNWGIFKWTCRGWDGDVR